MWKRQNLKLTTVIIFGILNLFLIWGITNDQQTKTQQIFLKEESPYYPMFQTYFHNTHLVNAWEKDLTQDKKPEFIFLSKQSCAECKPIFSIFQGERKLFEANLDTTNVILQDGGFTIQNGYTRIYEWTQFGFREVKDLT